MWQNLFMTFCKVVIFPIICYAIYGFMDWYKKQQHRQKQSKFFTTEHRKDQEISRILIEMRLKYNAARSFLTMFHNGTTFLEGSDDYKKSRTNEEVAPGVDFAATRWQDIRVGLMVEETNIIRADKPTVVRLTDLRDCRFRRMMEIDGTKAVTRMAVRQDGKTIGFIGLDFNEAEPPADVALADLEHYAGRVAQTLSNTPRTN